MQLEQHSRVNHRLSTSDTILFVIERRPVQVPWSYGIQYLLIESYFNRFLGKACVINVAHLLAQYLLADMPYPVEGLRRWVEQAEIDAGGGSGALTTSEREELGQLRRENQRLRMEREILKKATAFFARESV